MFRKIIKVETEADLTINLPEEYLNKEVEVIAFQTSNEENFAVKKKNAKAAIEFFKTLQTDMSNFKFNRDEANAR